MAATRASDGYSTGMTLGLIPARAGSKGILGKNTRPLAGKPLVQWTIECALDVRPALDVVISTDSFEVAEIAVRFPVTVLMRPPELAADDTPMSAVVEHVLQQKDYDTVVLLQPTAPLRLPRHVEAALELLPGADSVVSVRAIPAHYRPEWAYRITRLGLLRPVFDDSIIHTRRQDLPMAYHRDGTVYAFTAQWFRASHSCTGGLCRPLQIPDCESANIDTEDDWREAERKLEARHALV